MSTCFRPLQLILTENFSANVTKAIGWKMPIFIHLCHIFRHFRVRFYKHKTSKLICSISNSWFNTPKYFGNDFARFISSEYSFQGFWCDPLPASGRCVLLRSLFVHLQRISTRGMDEPIIVWPSKVTVTSRCWAGFKNSSAHYDNVSHVTVKGAGAKGRRQKRDDILKSQM